MAAAELIIGLGAFAVPEIVCRRASTACWQRARRIPSGYLLLSALVLAASILPWCVCMGATFPFMMAFVREEDAAESDSFSFLYLANVLGAMTGTILAAVVLVEMLGFRHTLALAAAGNFTIAAHERLVGWQQRRRARRGGGAAPSPPRRRRFASRRPRRRRADPVDFILDRIQRHGHGSGLDAGLYAGSQDAGVFVCADCVHLSGGDFLGSLLYRRHLRRKAQRPLGESDGAAGAWRPFCPSSRWIRACCRRNWTSVVGNYH